MVRSRLFFQYCISPDSACPVPDTWPINDDLTDLLSQSSDAWQVIPLEPLFVLKGHPGSPHFSHTHVLPMQLESVLRGAIVAAQFVVNHHRFSTHHSFTALFSTLYVLQAGPDAPEMGLALFAPRTVSGPPEKIVNTDDDVIAEGSVIGSVPAIQG